jgi:DnaJ-domain-containing protein 1
MMPFALLGIVAKAGGLPRDREDAALPGRRLEIMSWSFGLKSSSQNKQRVKYPRADERIHAHGVSCHLGQVIDISGGGMRVRTEGTPGVVKGEQCNFGVRSSRHQVSVRGQVVWSKRTGWKNYEIGVRWLNASPVHVELLLQLARYGFVTIEETKGDPVPPPSGSTPSGASSARAGAASGGQPPSAPSVEDLYAVLAVPRTAKHDEIQGAFRALARQLHPDVNKDPIAQERFTQVNKAYSVLRDPESRRRYDILLAGGSLRPGA